MSDSPVVVEAATTEHEAEAAVEIAEVQAERDVAIAETQAEAAVAIAEAQSSDDEDLEWLRAELAGLQNACAMNADALSRVEVENLQLREQVNRLQEQLTAMAALAGAAAGAAASETTPSNQEPSSEEVTQETEAAEEVSGAGEGGPANSETTDRERRRRYLR